MFQTPRQKNSYTQLQAQIESLESEKNNLKEDLVLQQYAYRSLKKDCDEVKEQLAELEAEEKATSTRYVECKKELQIWKRRANAAEAALSENKVELLAIKAGMRTIGDIVKGCESHQ